MLLFHSDGDHLFTGSMLLGGLRIAPQNYLPKRHLHATKSPRAAVSNMHSKMSNSTMQNQNKGKGGLLVLTLVSLFTGRFAPVI